MAGLTDCLLALTRARMSAAGAGAGVLACRHVATPSPEVFAVTKRKFHNVLQGVAPGTPPFNCPPPACPPQDTTTSTTTSSEGADPASKGSSSSKWRLLRYMFRGCRGIPAATRLTEEDKAKFLDWTRSNVERHWDDPDGPIMSSHVIVIDDPQRTYEWHGLTGWLPAD